MFHALWKSARTNLENPLIVVLTLFLYYCNNHCFKTHSTGIINYVLRCHFNDYLCGMLFVAYSNIVLLTRGYRIERLHHIILFCFIAGLFWEFVTPLFRSDSVGDWIDVVCYILGGLSYCGVINGKKHYSKK